MDDGSGRLPDTLGDHAAADWGGEEGVGPPLRTHVENRLRRGGLYCALRGYERWDRFAVSVASEPRLLAVVLAAMGWLVWAAILASANFGDAFRFINFVPFDGCAALALVLCIIAWRGMRAHERDRSKHLLFLLAGTGIVAAFFAAPYIAFSLGHLDTRVAGLLGARHDIVAAGHETLPPHLIATLVFVALLAIEVRTAVGEQFIALIWSALISAPRTFIDVLRTLPVVLTVLFFVAFTADTWQAFGLITIGGLVALILLLLGCLVIFVIWLARNEADRFKETGVRNVGTEEDADVLALRRVGVKPVVMPVDTRVRKAIVRQWISHIGLRIAFAGLLVTGLIWTATGLTMTPGGLEAWLSTPPNVWLDESLFGVRLCLTAEGLKVAAVLGAFASVVFAGLALGQLESRNDLLEPERKRIRRLLTLAGTYHDAIDQRCWRPAPGKSWGRYFAFLADEPQRWHSAPWPYGTRWSDSTGNGQVPRWRAAWNEDTGEMYIRSRRAGKVELLAVCDQRDRVEHHLRGWQQQEHEPMSLAWLRRKTDELASAGHQ
jgi:hypothetical protein